MSDIIELINNLGPITGKELLSRTKEDEYTVWKTCITSPDIITKIVGNRYLRLDRQVEGYARLSPSIMREFMNYTIIGLAGQPDEIDRRATVLEDEIIHISQDKFQLTQEIITEVVESQHLVDKINTSACVLIAGDVVYNMSHMEPRPEFSTGKMVQGSDLDMVIITDGLDDSSIKLLDHIIYQRKYMLIKNPVYRQEIDYLIKDISKMNQQLSFNDFESMVACKILDEGKYLYGNHDLFHRLKEELQKNDIPKKLRLLEHKAIVQREEAEARLINNSKLLSTNEIIQLFYATSEAEEFF